MPAAFPTTTIISLPLLLICFFLKKKKKGICIIQQQLPGAGIAGLCYYTQFKSKYVVVELLFKTGPPTFSLIWLGAHHVAQAGLPQSPQIRFTGICHHAQLIKEHFNVKMLKAHSKTILKQPQKRQNKTASPCPELASFHFKLAQRSCKRHRQSSMPHHLFGNFFYKIATQQLFVELLNSD